MPPQQANAKNTRSKETLKINARSLLARAHNVTYGENTLRTRQSKNLAADIDERLTTKRGKKTRRFTDPYVSFPLVLNIHGDVFRRSMPIVTRPWAQTKCADVLEHFYGSSYRNTIYQINKYFIAFSAWQKLTLAVATTKNTLKVAVTRVVRGK